MTQIKNDEASLLRVELQLLEQLFIDKFVQDEPHGELMLIRRRILALKKKAAESGVATEKERI